MMTEAPAIPWHRRMEAHVAVGVSILVALALGAILLATTRVVTGRSFNRAADDLETARLTFERSLESRADSVTALTQLVADLPVFRAHLTDPRLAGDADTIGVMVDGYRQQLKARFAIVTDATGAWLASPGWPEGADRVAMRQRIGHTLAGQTGRDIVAAQNLLYLVVSEPARFSDEVLGTMTVGYQLDDAVAGELARATHCQVSLVAGTHLVASTLDARARADLDAMVSGRRPWVDEGLPSTVRTVGDGRYVGGAYPLLAGMSSDSSNRLILLQDWGPTQQFVDELRGQFLVAAVVIFGFALAGGVLFSRRMVQPLKDIATAAGDIAAGNLTRKIPVRGTAEATTVAVAFNEMSTSLRAAHERLEHDAIHDHLTALPNRVLFMERLDRAVARRARHPEFTFAVLFADLDRFKTVNDSLGRPAGDCLLIEIARRLAGTLRREDVVARPAGDDAQRDADVTLARLGGDEFIILLEDIGDPIDAVRVAERVQQVVAIPVSLEGQDVFATASIGIAISTSAHRSGEDVVRDADLAMYRAKASGGDRCAICDATMHKQAVERLQLESDLRRAIERREFIVHYQPIVAFREERIVGFEALLRWKHPERGILLPGAFLEVATETGLIARIDDLVLERACHDARHWQTHIGAPLSVSVNVSAHGFDRPDLVDRVATTLSRTGLEPRHLRLEITEGIAMADAERTRSILTELRTLGLRISLDDFGTGYSSLSYLQRFPVDTLKIDRSFVIGIGQNDECREIIRTIVNLAHTLGLDVVAEGTETAAQVRYLEELHCAYGQGHFFSRPLPVETVAALRSDSAALLSQRS